VFNPLLLGLWGFKVLLLCCGRQKKGFGCFYMECDDGSSLASEIED
jgi:hypothetical protein